MCTCKKTINSSNAYFLMLYLNLSSFNLIKKQIQLGFWLCCMQEFSIQVFRVSLIVITCPCP